MASDKEKLLDAVAKGTASIAKIEVEATLPMLDAAANLIADECTKRGWTEACTDVHKADAMLDKFVKDALTVAETKAPPEYALLKDGLKKIGII